MNKQGENKIAWTDFTWNPITGCLAGCGYCYARKMYERFKKSFTPKLHCNRLNEIRKIKKPSRGGTIQLVDFSYGYAGKIGKITNSGIVIFKDGDSNRIVVADPKIKIELFK